MPLRLPLDVLQGMAREHAHYEVDRLIWWSHVQLPVDWFNVPSAIDPNLSDYVHAQVAQATLESALIHLRNVAEFLLTARPTNPAKKRWTDLVADDYFDDGWVPPAHVIGADLEEQQWVLNQIHWRVAHLTWHRYHVGNVGENQPFSWATVLPLPLVPGLLWQFRLFVDQLAVAHPARAGWFEETIIMILHPDQDPLHRPVS